MSREDDDPMDTCPTFDALIESIRARDATPGPSPLFTRALQERLTTPDARTRKAPMQMHATVLDRPFPRGTLRLGAGSRWAAIAATVALLLATVGGGYMTGIRLPRMGESATNIAAPLTGSPEAAGLQPAMGSPVAVERRVGNCETRKTYMSSVGGQMLLQSPQKFTKGIYPIDQMQLQHWSFGPGLGRSFPAGEMGGITGLVMDTVTNGVYRATFEGPVVVSTWYGSWLAGWNYTELTSTLNTVELGVGESVLYQAGTAHEVENTSDSRGLGIERLVLYAGDDSRLLPAVAPVDRPAEAILSRDTEIDGRVGITVRLDGTGTIAPDDAPPGWRNALITIEFAISLDDPLSVLVPGCESPETRQIRNVDEMFNSVPPPAGEPTTDQYIGYLVWIGEGGRG